MQISVRIEKVSIYFGSYFNGKIDEVETDLLM